MYPFKKNKKTFDNFRRERFAFSNFGDSESTGLLWSAYEHDGSKTGKEVNKGRGWVANPTRDFLP